MSKLLLICLAALGTGGCAGLAGALAGAGSGPMNVTTCPQRSAAAEVACPPGGGCYVVPLPAPSIPGCQ